jgi:hypothetical protein
MANLFFVESTFEGQLVERKAALKAADVHDGNQEIA